MQNAHAGWQFWIDRGGTFTDIVAITPGGGVLIDKLLSVNPERYADAAVHGLKTLMDRHGAADDAIAEIKLGSTIATNALLERRGEPTVLAITRGFADLLRIGHQARPDLFARHIRKPEPLYAEVVEIDERLDADGGVLKPLDLGAARRDLQAAYKSGFRAVAIVLMHAWRDPVHEQALAGLAQAIGFTQVSVSHEASALIKIVPRGETTVVDSYLSPPLARYLAGLVSALPAGAPLSLMQSNGGLAPAKRFRGRNAVLSGPAGGVVGMAEVARAAGLSKAIGFDMGGTSTDVSHFAGAFERTLETEIAGVRLMAPMIAIHTVAAGGGSICRFENDRLRVGPQSAGADPGPACYRRGGPLTITDCNLMLGRLNVNHFPALFGPTGDQPLDEACVAAKFQTLSAKILSETGHAMTPAALAEGFLAIAIDEMAHAIKQISVAKGRDLADYALVSFGGAGGQHACAVADALSIDTVLVSPLAGVLSAYGIGRAERRDLAHRTVERPLSEAAAVLDGAFTELISQLTRAAGPARGDRRFERRVWIKNAGTDTSFVVPFVDASGLEAAFHAAYAARFGFANADASLAVDSIEAELIDSDVGPELSRSAGAQPEGVAMGSFYMDGRWRKGRIVARTNLAPAAVVEGPALIHEATGATLLAPGWRARVAEVTGDLVLNRHAPRVRPLATTAADPISLEVFGNLFMAIAEQMGADLQATASSVNIKERLDFSCAVFDANGRLIANAPHMPVHLGSMGDSVRQVMATSLKRCDPLQRGDVYALNNPFGGGTHLPDITVVMPVFADDGGDLLAFVAARGHHADVGGVTPGSMPAFSRTLAEEGVLLDSLKLVTGGEFDEAAFRSAMTKGRWPARNVEQNLADIRAQVAACARGERELKTALAEHGRPVIEAYMGHLLAQGAAAVRRLLGRLESGMFRYEADDGWAVQVRVASDPGERTAVLDFTGSSAQLSSNFNAPPSIVRAASLYVIRTLLDEEIPMNDGCLEPIVLINPPGSLLNPAPGAAVAAGNVETSQVITDALYGAVGALAAAQGTMNNFTFGDATRQYYETICGGAGAGPGFDGASAVHTHMTNSRLTDPEVLEQRFPVLVEAFALRRGSGGEGRWRGGDGVVRRLRFLEPMTASILANRRRVPPFGLAGGGPGKVGINRLIRSSGVVETLPACATVEMTAGDAFEIETPGGGGFGAVISD